MLRPSLVPTIAFAALVSTSFASPAAATPQIAFGPEPNPTSSSPKGDAVVRDQGHLPYGVSFDDCEKDVTFTFTLIAAQGTFQTGADSIQAWAGVEDCSQTAARSAATAGTCVPVSAPVPLSAAFRVDVRGRDLVAASLDYLSTGYGGIEAMPTTAQDDSVCRRRTSPDGTPMNLTFLVFASGGGNDAEVALTYAAPQPGLDIVVDTVGPPAPTDVLVGVAPSMVKLFWTPTQSADEAGYALFCEGAPSCHSDVIVDGADGRTVDTKYICARPADPSASTSVIEHLVPDGRYAVAVAGVDLIGNVGPLALGPCALTPASDGAAGDPNAPVKAGCACGVTPSLGSGAGGAAAIALAALGLARRRLRTKRIEARTP